eukprot:GCRY01000167.1.p1 GENE.GCRY01000167.1~~GCRY01000167.1.p1  ORF type:complete len:379 (+),score=76.11 GCRY01000167.1:192-1328(+)
MKFALFLLLAVCIASCYGSCTPHPSWNCTAAFPEECTGRCQIRNNDKLLDGEVITLENLYMPEDFAIDDNGVLYTGLASGYIAKISPNGSSWDMEMIAYTGGRPLGLKFGKTADTLNTLYIADAVYGLYSLDVTTLQLTLLANQTSDGSRINYADDVEIDSKGIVYVTDTTHLYPLNVDGYWTTFEMSLYSAFESQKSGRILKYDPQTGACDVLVDGLFFVNSVAIDEYERFLIFTETYTPRLGRYWLKGPLAGLVTDFVPNLPMYPDNIKAGKFGTFWVAMGETRSVSEVVLPYCLMKEPLVCDTEFLTNLYLSRDTAQMIVQYDYFGNVIRVVGDSTGTKFNAYTSVLEKDGVLYMGTSTYNSFGVYELEDNWWWF